MAIHQIYTYSPYRNFNYLIDLNEKELLCVDPLDVDLIMRVAIGLGKEIACIVNTHEHWDHIAGNKKLKKLTGAKLFAHEDSGDKIEGVDRYLKHGDELELLDGKIKFLSTPGHTMSHLCLLKSDLNGVNEYIVTGDTLFNGGAGNCHNGGHPEELFETFENIIRELDDSLLIYPGHDYLSNNLEFTLSSA